VTLFFVTFRRRRQLAWSRRVVFALVSGHVYPCQSRPVCRGIIRVSTSSANAKNFRSILRSIHCRDGSSVDVRVARRVQVHTTTTRRFS